MDYETIQNEFKRAIFIALEQLGERSGELSWFCKDDDSGIDESCESK